MSPSYPQARLIEAFDTLTDRLDRLAALLRASTLPLWVPLTPAEADAGLDPRERAVRLYCDLWYQQGGDGRRTDSRHGLIAADAPQLAAAAAVNAAKADFQAAVTALRDAPSRGWLSTLNRRDSRLREDLNRKGLGRLHLKQCYRRLPLCPRHPKRVGFNWYTSGRSITRVSVAQVEKQLLRLGPDQPHVRLQLEQLGRLRPGTPLARVQQQAPLMRANLSFDGGSGQDLRQAMNLSLPLLFGWDPGRPFPEHNAPELAPPPARRRRQRSDCRLEASPFLPSLRIHRYREVPA